MPATVSYEAIRKVALCVDRFPVAFSKEENYGYGFKVSLRVEFARWPSDGILIHRTAFFRHRLPLGYLRQKTAFAPVAQGIEHSFPKRLNRVTIFRDCRVSSRQIESAIRLNTLENGSTGYPVTLAINVC